MMVGIRKRVITFDFNHEQAYILADLENQVFRDQSSHRWHDAVRLPGESNRTYG
jgi:hypothetical protein